MQRRSREGTRGFRSNLSGVDPKVTAETQERLRHALARLQTEPRSTERRGEDRRNVAMTADEIAEERRLQADRRTAERRNS